MCDAMTVKQKQCLLYYLGYYTGAIDGLWGPASEKAAVCFLADWGKGDLEEGLKQAVAKGLPVKKEGDFWGEIQYFSRKEFKCKCGGRYCSGYPAEMKRNVVLVADRVRKHFGAPGYVVSGLRCRQHNASSGGVNNSQHMYGEAVDLRIQGVSAAQLLEYIRKQPEVRYAYAINASNVHFDIPREGR